MTKNGLDEKDELIKAALLGTQRYELPAPDPESGLSKLYAQLSSAESPVESPHRLLSIAGAYYLRKLAGDQPLRVVAPVNVDRQTIATASSPTTKQSASAEQPSIDSIESGSIESVSIEQTQSCGKLASQNLATILWGYAPDLLSEFLRALAENNQRLPNQYLPTVLVRGFKSATLRPVILPVLGQSGRWLAAQNPEWAYATYSAETYDGALKLLKRLSGTKRQSFLRQLRQTDPSLTRELLNSQWKSLTSSERALFIKIVDVGLSSADEPFLEAALNDRNNVVRRKAAELLAKLPDSQLCKRMTASAEGFLNWTPDEDIKITVHFPSEITPQMIQDGVMLRKLRDESRVRAYQMKEIVGAIPLEHWTTLWGATPAEIIQATASSRWPRTLKQSFVSATERQKNLEWAKILLKSDDFGVTSIRLVDLLPIEECEAILKDFKNSSPSEEYKPLTKENLLVRLLRKRKDPWTAGLATIWFDQLVRHFDYDLALREAAQQQEAQLKSTEKEKPAQGQGESKGISVGAKNGGNQTKEESKNSGPIVPKNMDPIIRLLIRQSGRCCPTEITPYVVEKLRPYTQEFNIWRPIVQEVISTLKFRQMMLTNIESIDKLQS